MTSSPLPRPPAPPPHSWGPPPNPRAPYERDRAPAPDLPPAPGPAGRERPGADPPRRPPARRAARRQSGLGEDRGPAPFVPQRHPGPGRGADRDRPQER